MYTPLYVAKKAEARKNSRYLATARAMNHLFHPYAVETFGSCGAVLDNMLKALADRFRNMTTLVSNSEVSEKSQLVRFWRVKYLSKGDINGSIDVHPCICPPIFYFLIFRPTDLLGAH